MKLEPLFFKMGIRPTPKWLLLGTVLWGLPLGTLWLALFLFARKWLFLKLEKPLIVRRIH